MKTSSTHILDERKNRHSAVSFAYVICLVILTLISCPLSILAENLKPIIGDLDYDRDVDLFDLYEFASNWVAFDPNNRANFDRNGTIDSRDLALMAPYWLHQAPPVDGTFITFSFGAHDNFTSQMWASEFDQMDVLGFNTIIVIACVDKGYTHSASSPRAHYSSSIYSVIKPQIDWIMPMAQQRRYHVYLGLYDLDRYYDTTLRPGGPQEVNTESKRIAAELYSKFASYSCLKGFYIMPEALINEGDFQGSYLLWKDMTTWLHANYPSMKVMSAPYFIADTDHSFEPHWWTDRTPAQMAQQTKLFMLNSGLDIIVLQDAMSVHNTIDDLRAYIPPMAEAVRSIGRQFWADIENFELSSDKTAWIGAPISRVTQQIDIEQCADRQVFFIYRPHMTDQVESSRQLLEGYHKLYIAPKQ